MPRPRRAGACRPRDPRHQRGGEGQILEAIRGSDSLHKLSNLEHGQDGGPLRFTLSGIADMEGRVQETIQQISDQERVPVRLQDASLLFASVYGSGSARIELAAARRAVRACCSISAVTARSSRR